MSTLPADLINAALAWVAADPCRSDRHELKALLSGAMSGDDGAGAALRARMGEPLRFGTAGIRGPLQAGPAGMNLAVVRRTSAGIASYLRRCGAADGLVVVGYDGRHRSAEFARDAAGVLAAAGFRVLLAPRELPTPVTAFATRELDAVAALQVTASHNPAVDNGLKVYLAGGSQLVPPADAEIEAAIDAVGPAIMVPADGAVLPWPEDLVPAYRDAVAALPRGSARDLSIVATALHGVGGQLLVDTLRAAGFSDVTLVPEQAHPDPAFPTVPFPNPEEPGACDLLLALAEHRGADIAIAVDPDADRCAVGISDEEGTWRMLRGDETGALLGDYILATLDRERTPRPLVATTIVSGDMLRRVAAARDAEYAETLTGFKWIMRAGDGLVYGYEEAIGHAVAPDLVRDKDGVSTAVLACDYAATLRQTGRHLRDALDDLELEHGMVRTGQVSFRLATATEMSAAMERLRAAVPAALLGSPVQEIVDHLPETDAVTIRTEDHRLVARPSGTEPKLKCYLQATAPVAAQSDLPAARAKADAALLTLAELAAELLQLPT